MNLAKAEDQTCLEEQDPDNSFNTPKSTPKVVCSQREKRQGDQFSPKQLWQELIQSRMQEMSISVL